MYQTNGINKEVKRERTGWRDMELSERHRRWGWDCPAVDLDALFLEYDMGQPVAIVEYKNENARTQWASHPTYQALINLGNKAGIPVFGVRYATDFSWWRVVALNENARFWLPEVSTMSEYEWVTFLYLIRGREMPDLELFNYSNISL